MNAGTRLFVSLSLCAAAAALAVSFAARNVAAAGNPSANIDQCANGLVYAAVPCTGSAWQNGNTNANNSHWFEGDSIAYRMTFSSMSVGPTHRVTIQWDTTKGGAHALDYLTSYDRTEKVANGNNPCSGVAGCGSPTTFAIPADNHTSPTLQPSADDGRWNQVFTMFNGTITSVTVKDPALGNPEVPYNLTGTYAGDSSTSITITFTAATSTPVLAWGGHVATRKDWGANKSALAITGSPYHMRLLNLDGSGGNQDRSTSSSAVIFPALLTITKTVVDTLGQPIFGPTPFNYTTTSPSLSGAGPELPASFTLVHDGGVNAQTGVPNNQRQFKLYMFDTSSAQVTVKEQPVNGFVLGSLTCSASVNGVPQSGTFTVDVANATVSVIPVEGEEINCTYVNQQALTLMLIKKVINSNGGTALASAFTLRVTGSNTNVAKPGSATGTIYSVLPGTYTVSEDTPLVAGYKLAGFSGDCDASGTVVMSAGRSGTCTVTNVDVPGHLTINKVVVNTSGGTRRAADFSFSVNGSPATSFIQNGTDPLKGLNTVDVPAGAFTIVETATPIAGYATTYSGCSGTILNGATMTCTITNTNTAAHLVIKKVVVNNNGGTLTASNFSGTVSGVTASNGQTWTGASTDLTLTTLGSYSVAENAHPGYDATFSADCAGTIALGEIKTCTVTNDDQAARLTINKVVVNNNGGSLTPADFSGTISGTATSGQTWSGASTTLTLTKVGSYSVAENAHPGYDATFSAACTGTVALGDSKTCTVTNDDQPARLTLIKHVVNDNGGSATASAFTLTAAGSAIPGGSQAVTGTESPGVTIQVNAGSYSVTESSANGYVQVGAAGCSGTLVNGATATCTITNSDDKANPTGGSVMSWVLHDSLTVSGLRPGGSGGTVTFKLYGPDDATCSGSVINGTNGSGEVRPVVNGAASTAAGYNAQQAQLPYLRGTFRWIAVYSGDNYNDGASTRCGDEGHTVTVYDPAAPPYALFITPVNGAAQFDASQPFEWTAVVDAQAYYLYVGSSPGAKDLVNTGEIQETTYRAYGLPMGQLLYARLWTKKASLWRSTDISFTVTSGGAVNKATVIAPANGATGVSATGLLQWTAVPDAEKYYLYVGSTPGANDLIDSQEICDFCVNAPMTTSWSLANAGKPPAQGLAGKAGQKVYVTLWTMFGGVWRSSDSSFTVAP